MRYLTAAPGGGARSRASAGVKLTRMSSVFGIAEVPVTAGSAVVYVFASNHIISYWRALTLGWAIVPLAIFVRALRYARRADAQASRSFPLA